MSACTEERVKGSDKVERAAPCTVQPAVWLSGVIRWENEAIAKKDSGCRSVCSPGLCGCVARGTGGKRLCRQSRAAPQVHRAAAPAGNATQSPGSQTLGCCKLELLQIAEGHLLIPMPLTSLMHWVSNSSLNFSNLGEP